MMGLAFFLPSSSEEGIEGWWRAEGALVLSPPPTPSSKEEGA
jgi:hypothetical protein